MFRKISNNQKTEAKDESVRQEARQAEELNSIQPMGNEAANAELMDQMLNEMNAGSGRGPDKYAELNEEIIPDNSGIRIPPVPDKLNDSDYLNNSHNIVNEDWLESSGKGGRGSRASEKSNLISNEIGSSSDDEDSDHIISTSSKKKEKKGKKKPDQKDAENALEIAENILKDAPAKKAPVFKAEFDPLSTYAEDGDLAAVRGRKKGRKKKSKKSAENEAVPVQAGGDNVEGIEDARWKDAAIKRLEKMELMDQNPENVEFIRSVEMEKIKNWDFKAQKLDKIKSKPGKFRKFLTYFAGGMGKLLGLALQVVSLGHLWRLKSKARYALTDKNKWQKKKDYQSIPGWDGAKFDPEATGGEDILADFRRVPTVWSRLIAAKAAEKVQKNGREEEKPLDPVVSVMAEQPKPGSSQALKGSEMGHTMIGIEYSRRSSISGRFERYKLQYGFYPAGGTISKGISSGMTAMKHDAVMPGRLKDDYDSKYDVSRRYPAKNEQVNAIIKASEKYAEGGYSYYGRNCVTFVKEMVVNTAHLATGGDIFEKSEVDFGHLGNLDIFGTEAFNQNAIAGTENNLMDLMNQEDLSYQNFGNKRATRKDFSNYKKSMKKGSGLIKESFSPGRLGEQLRRMEGYEAGEIGSYKFSGSMHAEKGNLFRGLAGLKSAIEHYGSSVANYFAETFTDGELENSPNEMNELYNYMDMVAEPLDDLEKAIQKKLSETNKNRDNDHKLDRGKIREQYFVSPDQLRDVREKLSENISKINILLNNYLKNDERVHQPLLNLISLLNYGVRYVDNLYENTSHGGFTVTDDGAAVDDIRENMTHSKITVKAGGKDVTFTPSHYESYIQIYKDPKTAVEKYKRFLELRKKKDEDRITKAERIELIKMERIDVLADEFDNSHNYMLEKNDYKQQDIDYAFQLHNKETTGLQEKNEFGQGEEDINEGVRDKYKSASGIYITLIMDKFFSDLKEQWMKDRDDEGGISHKDTEDPRGVQKWMDKYLTDRINRKKKDFEMVIRGINRSIKTADPNRAVDEKDVMDKLTDVITQVSVSRNFENSNEPKESKANLVLPNAMEMISKNKSFEFTKLVSEMFTRCDLDDSGLELEIK